MRWRRLPDGGVASGSRYADERGDIVSSASIYGGSHNMFYHTLPRFGITATFVDPRDPDAFARTTRQTRG